MGLDHFVRPISEENISLVAKRCREISTATLPHDFNIVDFIENHMKEKLWRGSFDVEFFIRRSENEDPAFVKYKPLELYVDRDVWREARYNIPLARYILAHEAGHLCLHDHFDLSYSIDKDKQLEYASDIHSAEWQANTFAHHFLVPDDIVDALNCQDGIAISCSVPPQVALKRYNDRANLRSRKILNFGGHCRSCFRYDVYMTDFGPRCFHCKQEAPFVKGLKYRSGFIATDSQDTELRSPKIDCSSTVNAYEGDACKKCSNFSLIRSGRYLKCEICGNEEDLFKQYKFIV